MCVVSLSRNNLETCSPSTLHADDDAGRVDRSNQPDIPGLPKNNEPDFGRQHLLTSPLTVFSIIKEVYRIYGGAYRAEYAAMKTKPVCTCYGHGCKSRKDISDVIRNCFMVSASRPTLVLMKNVL